MEVSGEHHARQLYPWARNPVPIKYGAGWNPDLVSGFRGREKSLDPAKVRETRTFQPVAGIPPTRHRPLINPWGHLAWC